MNKGRLIGLLTVLAVAAILLTACSKKITVEVFDMGSTTEVQTKTGAAVGDALKDAGVELGAKDETDPAADFVIDEDTVKITVRRYAEVTVKKGLDSIDLKIVGGTVQDAVDNSGFTVDEGEELDHAADEYLSSGMVIRIGKMITVTLKADGKTSEIKTKAVTVGELLAEQGVALGADDVVSSPVDSKLKDGQKLTVNRVEYKDETRTESVDFKSEEVVNKDMYKGEKKVTREGVKGEKKVAYRVKYVDGKESSKEKLDEVVIKEPVNKIVSVGVKEKYDSYVGTWSETDAYGTEYCVVITSVTGSKAEVCMEKVSPNASHIATVGPISADIESDNTITFEYEDSFLNFGVAKLTLNGNSISLRAEISDFDEGYVFSFSGEAFLTKRSSSTSIPWR